jgi:hypothetical protein
MARQDTVVIELKEEGPCAYRFDLGSVAHTLRQQEDLWLLDDRPDAEEQLAFTSIGEAIHYLLEERP